VKPTPPPAGLEWLIDAHGCRPEALRDLPTLQGLCDRVVRELELRVVGEPLWHRFPGPGGVTGIFLLTESHLTVHTFPEGGLATFNLYCCRPRRPWPWRERLAEALGAIDVSVRELSRGEEHP
jgi:S-adenosylmethionine decarboxylase